MHPGEIIVKAILYGSAFIIAWLLLRPILLWYWKLDDIAKSLKEISRKLPDPTPDQETTIEQTDEINN